MFLSDRRLGLANYLTFFETAKNAIQIYYGIRRLLIHVFLIPQAKVAHSLPAVLTKVPLFTEGMRKNSIRDSGVNKECLKQQAYHPRLRLGR